VIFAPISPNKVFLFLVNSSGAVALSCYLLLAAAEPRMRRLEAEAPERLKLRMWLFPRLTYLAIAAMVAVIASMAFVKDARPKVIPSVISLAIVLRGALAHAPGGGRGGARWPVGAGAWPATQVRPTAR
jgi:GABA permease